MQAENDWITVAHGRLQVSVPADWTDASTITLAGPSQRLPGARMATSAGREFASNVSMVMVTRPESAGVEDYHASVAERLRKQNVTHRVLETKPVAFASADGIGVLRAVFVDGVWIRQLQAVVAVEEVFVVVTVSTLDGAPAAEWETLQTIVASIALTAGATSIRNLS